MENEKIIRVVKSTGIGNNSLGAFDNALFNAGVHNYNLIRLSSVVPEEYTVVKSDGKALTDGKWGDKLYVVMAIQHADKPGEEAHAGIGWAYDINNSEQGLFVEHEGTSLEYVETAIRTSLKDLFESRGLEMGEIDMITSSIKCEDKPVVAFCVSAFEAQGWNNLRG